jgi:hypothetical protein
MNYQTQKFLRQLGVVLVIAAVLMILPRMLVASIMGLFSLAVTIIMVLILYRILGPILGPIYRDYRRRHGPKRRQNWYSDRR